MSSGMCLRTLDGWFRGCLAATAALDATLLLRTNVSLSTLDQIAGLGLFAVFFVPASLIVTCTLTGLPAGVVVWFGEWLRIRSVFFYGGAGATIGLLVCVLIFGPVRPLSVPFIFAGGIAGVVYWVVAGRCAGEEGQWSR